MLLQPPSFWTALLLTLASATAVNAQYWVDSESGNVPANCDNNQGVWDVCGETSCPGVWEQLAQVNLPCLPVGEGDNPQCGNQLPEYWWRRVSGSYAGWADRNGMLAAYFNTNPCFDDGNWFFIGGKATYAWAALRESNGGWINVEFEEGPNAPNS